MWVNGGRIIDVRMPCHKVELDQMDCERHRLTSRYLDEHFTSIVSLLALLVDLCVDSPLVH